MFTSSGAGAICCSVTTQRPSGRHIYTRQICGLWHLWRGLVTRDAGRDTLIMSSGCTNLFLILTWIQFTLRRLLSKCSTVSSRCSPHKSSGAWQPSYQDCSWCYCQHVTTCVQTAGTWLVTMLTVQTLWYHTHTVLIPFMFMICLLKIIFAMYELSEKNCNMNFMCHQLCVDIISTKSRQCNIWLKTWT